MSVVRFRLSVVVFLLIGFLAARAADTRTVVFFGDSLTAGYGLSDPGTQAYPALLQEKIHAAKLDWRVVNAGLSGETSAAGLRRIGWLLRQPIQLFVLALGGNDGLRGINPDVTRQNLDQILERVRAKNPNAKLVLAGMQMPPSMGADYVRAFQDIFPAVARKHDATLLPFLLESVGGDRRLNQSDQIHPTAEGHELIAETLWKTLRPLL